MKKRALILVVFLLAMLAVVYAATFSDVSQSDFNQGSYANTTYNGSGVILSGSNLSGTYTSRIFDAGSEARWNNISWIGNLPILEFIFAADNQADVWKSADSGATWSLIKDDYNNANGNGVTASFFNSSESYFIIYNQDIWISQDLGVTWTKVNDDYNGAEGQNAFVATSDKNNKLYIIEGGQDVWRSDDSGYTWAKVSTDFNGGNGNFGGVVVSSSNILIATDLAADIWKSDDEGITWSLVKDNYNGGAGNNADGMAIDLNNIVYIADLQDVWKSNDLGVTWTKVNDDFNGAGDSEGAKSVITDSNNNVYIIDGGEDVFKSTDGGETFTEVATNFNGANGITPTMASLVAETNLSFQVRNCSLADCSDGSWQTLNLSNINLSGRYFQYKGYFASQDFSITSMLYNVSLDYTILDNVAPSFSNYAETPANGSAYVQGQTYRFNVTITEANPGSAWIEWQNVNYTTGITNVSNVFSFNRADLPAEIYYYRWWANDTLGNLNSSETRFYTIVKATSITGLAFDKTSPQFYGTSINASCTTNNQEGNLKLYRNGTDVTATENNKNIVLAADLYNYDCNVSETQNYTSATNSSSFTINKTNPSGNMNITGTSSITYGTLSDFVEAETNTGDDNCIYSIDKENGIYGVGTWIFNYSTSGCENYTAGSVTKDLVVNKASTSSSIVALPISPITYETTSNFYCSNTEDLEIVLYINFNGYEEDKTSENGLNVLRAAGSYNIDCVSLGNQNYTGSSAQTDYLINKAQGDVKLYLNGIESDRIIDYPQASNITATTLYGNLTIYLNGTDITSNNGENITLNAGYYNVTSVSSGNQNYSQKSITRWLNVTYDRTIPQIRIIYPEYISYNFIVNEIEYTVSDINLENCWYEYNGQNYSVNCGENISITSDQGTNIWKVYANDTVGNMNESEVVFFVDSIFPSIRLEQGTTQEGNYSQNYIEVNSTASDNLLVDSITFYLYNVTSLIDSQSYKASEVYTNFTSLQDGVYYINASVNDTVGNTNYTETRQIKLDSSGPEISIQSPEEKMYGHNQTGLNFSVSDISEIDSCWYNLGNSTNENIPNCENISFNTSDGDYIIYIYANDSLGNIGSNSVSFSIRTNGPILNLIFPKNKYLNQSGETIFNYTIDESAFPVEYCELYGDWTGEFKLNQTASNPSLGSNFFLVNLSEGNYNWRVLCNDSQGIANKINARFSIDTTAPLIIINDPKGTKNSRIITARWSILDASPVSCVYNVYRGLNLEVANTSANCSLNSTTFNVTVDADFAFNFYVNDSAGNSNFASSGFSVDTTPAQQPENTGGSGGGGGIIKPLPNLEIQKIGNLIVDPGKTSRIVLSVQNTGKLYLNDCKLKGKGKNAGWILSEKVKGLSIGEKYDFVFTLNVPVSLEVGAYLIELEISCQEYSKSANFTAEMIEKKLAVDLIKAERKNKDGLEIVYSLAELSGYEQNVKVDVVLFSSNNERIAETSETKSIKADSRQEFTSTLEIPAGLEGSFNLLINAISGTSSAFVQEEVVLGKTELSGMAIFRGESGGKIFSIVLIVLFGIFAIFIVRRIWKLKRFRKRLQIQRVRLKK